MILNRQRKVRVARGPLDAFLRRVRKELELAGSKLTVCLVSDAEMARMNEAFRKKKGPTDVLSFPAGKLWRAAEKQRRGRSSPARYLGDIAIAPETARRW